MRITKFNLVIIVALTLGTSATSADEMQNSLKNEKFTADLGAFYMDGDRKNRTDRVALAVGGILKYESDSYNGFKFGTAFYLSHDILQKGNQTAQKGSIANGGAVNIETNNLAGNSDLVNSDGSSIESLGEVYVQYNTDKTTVKVGRQRLDTPLANDYYNRFLPNSFEAAVVENRDLKDTTLVVAYIYGWKYKAKDEFIGMTEGLGNPKIDKDVMMLGVINKSVPNSKLQAYLYAVPDVANSIYIQADNSKLLEVGGAEVFGAAQYLTQKDGGDSLYGKLDTYLGGAELGVKFKNFKISGMYDQVGDDTIIGSGTSYSSLGWSKFINFTDIQIDGEALNAGAISYGGVVDYAFENGLNPAIKFVRIDQNLEKEAASTFTGNIRPSSNEWNLDVKYKIDAFSKARVRFAKIDYESTHKNEFDENNLRIIYDYKFSVGAQ
ncbi:MAG: OprD family outer membrane porin [Campylobacterales bacterium]|nr:OprD family outer membrane porin [Campylobacterales bacterium]